MGGASRRCHSVAPEVAPAKASPAHCVGCEQLTRVDHSGSRSRSEHMISRRQCDKHRNMIERSATCDPDSSRPGEKQKQTSPRQFRTIAERSSDFLTSIKPKARTAKPTAVYCFLTEDPRRSPEQRSQLLDSIKPNGPWQAENKYRQRRSAGEQQTRREDKRQQPHLAHSAHRAGENTGQKAVQSLPWSGPTSAFTSPISKSLPVRERPKSARRNIRNVASKGAMSVGMSCGSSRSMRMQQATGRRKKSQSTTQLARQRCW
jgi:hypothetical protein